MKKILVVLFLIPAMFIACNSGSGSSDKKEEVTAPKTYEERIRDVEIKIRNTPDWLESIKKKAADQNIALDSMIHKDAVWMIDEEDGSHKPMATQDSAVKK